MGFMLQQVWSMLYSK